MGKDLKDLVEQSKINNILKVTELFRNKKISPDEAQQLLDGIRASDSQLAGRKIETHVFVATKSPELFQ